MFALLDNWRGVFTGRHGVPFVWHHFDESLGDEDSHGAGFPRELLNAERDSLLVVQSTGFLPLGELAGLWRSANHNRVTVIRNGSDKQIVSVVAPVSFLLDNLSHLPESINALQDVTTITLEPDRILTERKNVGPLWEVRDDWFLPDHQIRHLLAAQPAWRDWPQSELLKPLWFRRGENSPVGSLVRLIDNGGRSSPATSLDSTRPWSRSDIDVVAVTTDRFKSVRELLRSVRIILGGEVGITIVIQQPDSLKWRLLAQRYGARFLHVDHDSGLSWSRNHGIANTSRPLVFLMDDDFQVDDRCRVDAALEILSNNDEISVLGGNLLDVHHWKDPRSAEVSQGFAMRMVAPPPELVWLRVEDAPRERIFHNLTDYVEFCDIVDNFALIRRDRTFDRGVWWNLELKIGAEHQDFYLRFNEKGAGSIARTNTLKVRNVRVQSAAFRRLRSRTDMFFRVLFDRWGLRSFRIIGERTRAITADGGHAYLQGPENRPHYVSMEKAS
jgi:hypothetical protein